MKWRILILMAAALIGVASCAAQTDNTYYAKQFPGADVGTKVANAQRACNSNAMVPCIIVIDPSLAVWPTGTMPALCAQCSIEDYRQGISSVFLGASSDTQTNLLHWRSKLQGVKDGTGNATVCAVGDSTVAGYISAPSGTDYAAYAWPAVMASDLVASYGINADRDSWMGDGVVETARVYDARIVAGSSWSQDQTIVSLGYATLKASTSANPLAFTPTGAVNTFRIFYVQDTTQGSISANIDGGSATIQSTNGNAAVGTLTLTAGSVGTHTLNIYWSSGGQVNIIGTMAYDSTSTKVHIVNAGSSAENSTQAANTSKAYGGGNSAIYSAIGCDLTILEGGPNDYLGGNVSLFSSNNQTIINSLLAAGSDIIVFTPVPANPATETPVTNQLAFVSALRSLAASNGNAGTPRLPLPIIDNYVAWQSWANGVAENWYADTNIHPNATGQQINAKAVESAIANAPAQMMIPSTMSSGGYNSSWTTITGDYTLSGQFGTVYILGGPVTVTLPVLGIVANTQVTVVNATNNATATIRNNGAADNVPEFVLPGQALTLVYVGGNNWWATATNSSYPNWTSVSGAGYTATSEYAGVFLLGSTASSVTLPVTGIPVGFQLTVVNAVSNVTSTIVNDGVADNIPSAIFGGQSLTFEYAGGSNWWLLSSNFPSTVSGVGTATFAAGAAAGSSPGTPTCYTVCDSVSGTVLLTTGTTPPATGVALTVTLGGVTRATTPNCVGSVFLQSSGAPVSSVYIAGASTTTMAFKAAGTALSASTGYGFIYICGGK
jgi:lysophospholipase L1-like esterase